MSLGDNEKRGRATEKRKREDDENRNREDNENKKSEEADRILRILQ